MDNLSAQQKLMGNMQATSAELLSGIMEERGRGFASDREAWAQLKENIENVESRMKAIKDVHKDMWSAVKDHNGDAFCALAGANCCTRRRSACADREKKTTAHRRTASV